MKQYRIRSIIFIGALSLIGIIIFQVYWVNRSFDVSEQQFNQSVKVALLNVARDMAEFNGSQIPNQNPVQQLSYNYFVVDLNDFIDARILEHYLKSEFSHSNLDVDYEYAIYDCTSDEMVYGNYINGGPEKNRENPEEVFPKFEDYLYYFGVRFPGKTIHLLSSSMMWYTSAFVLIMAILFFTFAIGELIRQKKLSEVQKDFINNMSHEFKTPISTIGISAHALAEMAKEKGIDRLKKYAEIIDIQNIMMQDKVEKILQASLAEKSQLKLHKEKVDLKKLLERIYKSVLPRLEKFEGIMKLDIPEKEEFVITADPFHLENILLSIIDNSIKYSNKTVEIKLALQHHKQYIEIILSDRGPGIPPQYHKKIFKKFYRIPTGDIHNVKGFGLGLHYVRSIIRAHGWKIRPEGNEGQGSRFIIRIPQRS